MIRVYLVATILAMILRDASAQSYTCAYCLPGKYKSVVANDACLSCPADKYQPNYGMTDQVACQACTPYSVALSGSVLYTDCKCNLGYTGPDGGSCATCVEGQFKSVNGSAACTNCAAYSDSPATSIESTACTCNTGYTGSNGGPCLGCASNYYKPTTGSVACTGCPANSNSPVNSTLLTACLCNAGFTGADGGPCSSCPAGKYKVESGSGACQDCSAGFYSTATSKTDATCATCPAFTSAVSGSSALLACRCLAGYNAVNDGEPCTACVAGTYKAAIGTASACTNCGLSTYSTASAATSAATCVSCADVTLGFAHLITTTTGVSALAGCQCEAGWSGTLGDGTYCYQCLAGTFKSSIGSASCTPCAQGYYSTTLNATTGDTCLACTANSYSGLSSSASAACTCNTGYTGVMSDVCVVTGPKVNVAQLYGVTVTASSTRSGTKLIGLSATPTPTFDPMYLINGLKLPTDFNTDGIRPISLNGWASVSITTTGAVFHWFRLDLGSAKSIQEVSLYWHAHEQETYPQSVINSGTDPWNKNIKIQVGDIDGPNQNTNCASGINSPRIFPFSTTEPSSSVINCVGTGRYVYVVLPSLEDGSVQRMHIQEIEVWSAPMECGACAACAAGKYKGATGSAVCDNCIVGTYSTTVAATGLGVCETCPSGSTTAVAGTAALASCTCPAGWIGANGGACTECGAGKYKVGLGPGVCENCPPDTYSTTAGATGSGTCLTCAALQTAGGVAKAPGTGNSAATACKCDVGYTGGDGTACTACLVGTYKNTQDSAACTTCTYSTYNALTAQTSCTACQEYAVSGLGTTALTGCQCAPGYTGPNGGVCTGCYAGTYKTFAGTAACTLCGNATYSGTPNATLSSVCTACPSFALSYAGSQVLSDCKCDFGYYTQNISTPIMSCQQCLPGTFNSELGVIACSKCTAGYYSINPGSTSQENCLPCSSGYWSAEGKAQCEVCAPNADSLIKSGAQTDCKCNAGYTGGDGGPCNFCLSGTYKVQNGSAACTLCGVNKYSTSTAAIAETTCLPCFVNQQSGTGSDDTNDCKCNMGYTSTSIGVDGPACAACAMGKYKTIPGYTACLECPMHKYADFTGSISADNCTACFDFSVTFQTASTSIENCTCTRGYQRA